MLLLRCYLVLKDIEMKKILFVVAFLSCVSIGAEVPADTDVQHIDVQVADTKQVHVTFTQADGSVANESTFVVEKVRPKSTWRKIFSGVARVAGFCAVVMTGVVVGSIVGMLVGVTFVAAGVSIPLAALGILKL